MLRFSPRPNRAHLVNWREWGEAAFEEAREQEKPVAVFIHAFWCGFCHRMDETSLSNDDVIAVLNGLFVPVRVEESQRPDVDIRYNQNGWPTIVFLTPDGGHLLTVNYTAPRPFLDALAQVAAFYEENKVEQAAPGLPFGFAQGRLSAQATSPLPATPDPAGSPLQIAREPGAPLGMPIVAEIAGMVEGLADHVNGGFGAAPKLFHAEACEFLLYLFEATGEEAFLDHVLFTLVRMRESRTFDSRDGGFFRYSSKADWGEPHPEKLLDDQAALLRLYLHAYLLTEQPRHRETAEGLIEYLDRTLWDGSRGVFSGCQDYVRPQYVSRPPGGPAIAEPGSYIDHLAYSDSNARAASALLYAWWLLGREDCRERAQAVLEWLWLNLRAPDGGMFHFSDGEPRVPGLLADATAMGSACLEAYALLGDPRYLVRAEQLADYIMRGHRAEGGFADIAGRGPASLRFPLVRLTENAAVASFLGRLAAVTGAASHREAALWALRGFPNSHREYGAFAASYGQALARLLAPPLVATLAGQPGHPGARALLRAALTGLRYQNVALQCREERGGAPRLDVAAGGRSSGPLTDPAGVRPELVAALTARA